MKKLIFTITFILFSVVLFSQASKSFFQSFSFNQGTSISLELYGDVVVQKWDQSYVRVEASVTLENATAYALDNLQSAGRYKLLSTNDGINLHIYNIPTQYRIKISGTELIEKISYKILVPSFSDNENISIIFPELKEYIPNQKPIN